MVYQNFKSVYQNFKCDLCGRQRTWGATTTREGFELVHDPILLCEGCGEASAHTFVEFQFQTFSASQVKPAATAGTFVLVPTLFDPSVYEVEVDVVNRDGDVVETEVGTSELGGLTGRDRKDTVMKAITRAKNRGLLAAAGESSNDESEYDAPRSPRAVERPDTPARRLPVPRTEHYPPCALPDALHSRRNDR